MFLALLRIIAYTVRKTQTDKKTKLLRCMQICFHISHRQLQDYILYVYPLATLSYVCVCSFLCHNENMFFFETKWKNCILIITLLIISQRMGDLPQCVDADWTSITLCGDLIWGVDRSQLGEEPLELASKVRCRRLGHCIYALDDAKLYTCSLAEEQAWLVVEDVDHFSCCPAMVAQFHLDSTGWGQDGSTWATQNLFRWLEWLSLEPWFNAAGDGDGSTSV